MFEKVAKREKRIITRLIARIQQKQYSLGMKYYERLQRMHSNTPIEVQLKFYKDYYLSHLENDKSNLKSLGVIHWITYGRRNSLRNRSTVFKALKYRCKRYFGMLMVWIGSERYYRVQSVDQIMSSILRRNSGEELCIKPYYEYYRKLKNNLWAPKNLYKK